MTNPFLRQDFWVCWPELTAAHVVEAVDQVLARADRAIEEIASSCPGAVTFESTFLALERATEELNTTWAKIGHLQAVADHAELRAAYAVVLPRVSTFLARIHLNAALWARLQAFVQSPAASALQGVRLRFVEETARDFLDAGADLPVETRNRLEALQAELAQLTQKFSENVLDATNSWQLLVPPGDESRLAGLPAHARAMARRNAEAKGLSGWRFTLQQPSVEPVLTYADNRELRREVWEASSAIGSQVPYDNSPVIRRILELRREKADLLGQSNFAETVLRRRMAGSGERALRFVEDLQERCAGKFRAECEELENFAASQSGGPRQALAPWDIAYWAERLRRARFDLDEEALRPFFPLDRVVSGLFDLAYRVFGLRISERPAGSVGVWHPEVRCYDLYGETGQHLGSFYADWHPRESKRSGAWMNYIITGGPRPDGRREPHLGLICGNLTPPAGDRPALLTHREVETVFHEFGHLIHHLVGEVEIKSLNGVNVAWDFVELPSQIMENWTWERESLDLFARHFENGSAIPEDLFRKMISARNYRAASAAMRQVAFAKLDLLLHMRTAEFTADEDLEPRLRSAIAECLIPTNPPARTIVKRFSHLFGDPVGYAAGYYSYKWAEVLEADAFTRFQREGLFNRAVGAEFVERVLSRGNSAPPAELFRSFMGRDPDPTALLIRAGLAA